MSVSEQLIVRPFDVDFFQLPSCLEVHRQLRSKFEGWTSTDYVQHLQRLCQSQQSKVCGIVRQTSDDQRQVLALAFYRIHLTTFDRIRFELHDLVVDRNERRQGLGTRLLQYLIAEAKQVDAPWLVLQCDLTNIDAHRFFFRHGFTVSSFGFAVNRCQLTASSDQFQLIDITEVSNEENERILLKSQRVFRQLRPNLSEDPKIFVEQIRKICQTGPAHVLMAMSNDEKSEVLGIATYRVSETIKYSKHIYCDDLVTDENRRSSGVGRSLVNRMKSEVLKLGLNLLALDSGCQRGRAHRFYHREGFHIDQFEMALHF